MADGSVKKLRGGYYTPKPIADFLAAWGIVSPTASVLEPSAGDGALVAAAAERLDERGSITAIEIEVQEALKAQVKGGARALVFIGDFFEWFLESRADGTFDTVIANPPFIRYQSFPERYRRAAFRLMQEEGLHPSRLTNAWVPFVVGATRALRPGGRLALVLPAELLQVTYAAELRGYLARRYSELTVVTFRRLTFAGIQQETILLLGVRRESTAAKMSFMELTDSADLDFSSVTAAERVEVDLDHAREKWTQYYLTTRELGLVRELECADIFGRLGDVAEIDVGIVTGRNEFFVMTKSEADSRGLTPWCVPLIGRSAQISGLALRQADWVGLSEAGTKSLLLNVGDLPMERLPRAVQNYIRNGELAGFHEGYKCAIRLPHWWKIPSAWIPDAFLLRQIHDAPRIVANDTDATCTDTIHRVRLKQGIDKHWLASVSINSLTLAFSEVRGRSYGGGVLELEPTEAEGLPFPKPGRYSPPLAELDACMRSHGTVPVLEVVDGHILRGAGLSTADIASLRTIWEKLRQRRAARRKG